MGNPNEIPGVSEFGIAMLYLLGGIMFVIIIGLVSKLMAPNRPNKEKLSSYECGEDPEGNARIQLNMRFYVAALIFLIFDVEIVFLFPWATVFADKGLIAEAPAWGWFSLIEALLFAGILILGLAYVWKKGDLDWVKPDPVTPPKVSAIPESAYEAVNEKYG